MGSLAKALQDETQPKVRKGEQCTVCALIERSDADDVRLLEKWLSDATKRYTAISDRLRDNGIGDFESRTLSRHARGECWEMRQQGRRLR